MKPCQRFSYHTFDNKYTEYNALVYCELLGRNCPKKSAKRFCSKHLCKFDSTQRMDGPAKYRMLKVKTNPYTIHQGWQYSDPEYKFNENRINCLKQYQERYQSQNELEDKFTQQDQAKKPEWQLKEEIRKNVDHEVEENWKFHMDVEKKTSNIKELRDKFYRISNQDTEFYFKNQKFQSLSNVILKGRVNNVLKRNSKNTIDTSNLFQDISSNPDINTVKIQPFNKGKQSCYDSPLQLLKKQNSIKFCISTSPKEDDLIQMINENSDEDDDYGIKNPQKQRMNRIKELLKYGTNKPTFSIFEAPQNQVSNKPFGKVTSIHNISKINYTQESDALVKNYLEDMNSTRNKSLSVVNSSNILQLKRRIDSINEKETTRQLTTHSNGKTSTPGNLTIHSVEYPQFFNNNRIFGYLKMTQAAQRVKTDPNQK